jgi:hypothetical protein
MKRTLGSLAVNWLRKPENREQAKRTARDLWQRFDQRRQARRNDDSPDREGSAASTQTTRSGPPGPTKDE